MVMMVRDALSDDIFRTARAQILSGDDEALDKRVRWVYTNERADIATFLSGGEMLVIEGNALQAIGRRGDTALPTYIDDLCDAGVSALVIELVQGVTEVPPSMLEHAEARGFIVVGLFARVPFVNICERINTRIVQDEISVRMQADSVSAALHEALASARTPSALASALSGVFRENVAIFDPLGDLVASCTPAGPENGGSSRVLEVDSDGMCLGTIEISNTRGALSDEVAREVCRSAAALLSGLRGTDMGVNLLNLVMAGPADDLAATPDEARDTAAALSALGVDASYAFYPFAVRLRSPVGQLDAVLRVLDDFETDDACIVCEVLHGDVLLGFLGGRDAMADPIGFLRSCHDVMERCATESGAKVDVVRLVDSAEALVTAFGALAAMPPIEERGTSNGCVRSYYEDALRCLMLSDDVRRGVQTMSRRCLGESAMNDQQLMDTLCACFDAASSKSAAADLLGIRRQTLYGRLDRLCRISGCDIDDAQTWAVVTTCAKMLSSLPTRHLPS